MKDFVSKVSAKGQRGCLLDTFDGNYYFRVYNDDGSFKDYLVRHCDLEITLHDDDATFYEYADGTLTLDHSYDISENQND